MIKLHNFIIENYTEILFPFLNFIPDVGGNIKELAEKFLELKTKFISKHESLQINELDDLNNFLNDFIKKKGTIYETDFYTELIISLISKLKNNNKKVVLIIDDLDRIDPEHIFRLLNIFSAHTDIRGDESNYNKFNLDKIIFVCDIENIRSTYRTKFGINTDFNGYVDKFYSRKIFHFNISEILYVYLNKILENIKIGYDGRMPARFTEYNYFATNFVYIIEQLFFNNLISLRDLSRICAKPKIKLDVYSLERIGLSRYYNTNFCVIQYYDILLQFYGNDKTKLIESIRQVSKQNIHQDIETFIKRVVSVNLLPAIAQNQAQRFIQNKQFIFKNATVIINESHRDDELIDCQINDYDMKSEEFNYFVLLASAFDIVSKNL